MPVPEAPVKIVWEPIIYAGQAPVLCVLCGTRSTPIKTKGKFVIAVVYNDRGAYCGEACRHCVHARPESIKELLQERLTRLQAQVLELEELADEEIRMPTLEEEFRSYG
jgi:hypothetical protein